MIAGDKKIDVRRRSVIAVGVERVAADQEIIDSILVERTNQVLQVFERGGAAILVTHARRAASRAMRSARHFCACASASSWVRK